MGTRDRKEAIEKRIQDLPIVDVSVLQLLSILEDPTVNFEKVAASLSPDVASLFLKIANSAYHGREVSSIAYAVRALGFNEMKNILTSSILMSHLVSRVDLKGFSFEKFQRQAWFCGAVSRVLGQILCYEKLEDLFTVAILQNIGKLLLACYYKEEFHKINTLKTAEGIPTVEAEQRVLGTNHAEIGALFLKRFDVPEDICNAVLYHNSTDRNTLEGPNYRLEFIAREATIIVGKFMLPDQTDPMEIVDRLRGTVAEGRRRYHKKVQEKLWQKGYSKIFVELLKDASDLVCRDLGVFLKER